MFKHEKMLFHTVEVEIPNPQYAVLLQDVDATKVQETGSNRDFGTTKAAKMYFSMSNPGPNTFATEETHAPSFK